MSSSLAAASCSHSSSAAGTLRPQQRRAPFGATRVRAALWTPPGSDEQQPQQQEQPRGLDRPWVVRAEQQTAAPPRDLRGDPMGVLLRQRIIFLGGEVEDFGADSLVSQLLMLDQQDPGKDIKLFINSPGGGLGDCVPYVWQGVGMGGHCTLSRLPTIIWADVLIGAKLDDTHMQ
jgi:hypothetical protein